MYLSSTFKEECWICSKKKKKAHGCVFNTLENKEIVYLCISTYNYCFLPLKTSPLSLTAPAGMYTCVRCMYMSTRGWESVFMWMRMCECMRIHVSVRVFVDVSESACQNEPDRGRSYKGKNFFSVNAECAADKFPCFRDCCGKGESFCNTRRQVCEKCSRRRTLCGNETMPVECLHYCDKIRRASLTDESGDVKQCKLNRCYRCLVELR